MLVETKQGVNPARRKSWLFVLAKQVLRRRRKPRLSPPTTNRLPKRQPVCYNGREKSNGYEIILVKQMSKYEIIRVFTKKGCFTKARGSCINCIKQIFTARPNEFCPLRGQGTSCPNSSRLRRDLLEPASDTQQKQHRRKVRALKEFCPLRGKALRARIARAFGATYSSLLLTHYKSGTDGRCAPLRSFAPCGGKARRARTACRKRQPTRACF